MRPNAIHYQLLAFRRRHPWDAAGLIPSALQQRAGHIIAVAHSELVRMGRAHAMAAIIKETPGENAGSSPKPDFAGNSVGGKPGLHRLEQVAVEDRLMLSRVNLGPVHDLADVEPVLEQMRQRPDRSGCRLAPSHRAERPPWYGYRS